MREKDDERRTMREDQLARSAPTLVLNTKASPTPDAQTHSGRHPVPRRPASADAAGPSPKARATVAQTSDIMTGRF